jgi:acetylornithine deacetylase/succinyl-diaminopimelate desuccinylase-like protein
LDEDHEYVRGAVDAFEELFVKEPVVDKWTFSTNGVSIMGRNGIPCIGFGPANEVYAHTVDDQVPVEHLLKAAQFYALYPEYL